MQLFLGIDGGGTRTTAWLADEGGRVVGRALAGPSNPLKVGFEACEREILRAANAAVAAVYDRREKKTALSIASEAGFKPGRRKTAVTDRRYSRLLLNSVVVGLAGVDRPPVHSRILKWLRKSIPARRHLLTSDAAIALHAAVGNSPGILVISGTGSITCARGTDGNFLRSGGWGSAFDDAGSGYDIGRRAIVAALHDFDGRGHHTILGARICRALRLRDISQIILKPLTPQEIASLFPIVLAAARRADRVAGFMLDVAAYDLSSLALALVDRLRWKHRTFPVVCAGGVFTASIRIRKAFSLFIHQAAPRARVMLLRKQPVEGAVALARELAGASATHFPARIRKASATRGIASKRKGEQGARKTVTYSHL